MANPPFSDIGLKWFEDIVNRIIDWFADEITSGLRTLTNQFFGTPLPDGEGSSLVFSPPASSDEPWHSIYQSVVAGETMVFALLILFVAVQGRHFIRIFNFSSAFEERKTKRSAWTGAVLIVSWYWLAVLGLYFVDGLTIGLIPDLRVLSTAILDTLPEAAGNPGITLVMAMIGGISMLALKAIYFIREVLLYVYLYGMPIGIAIAFGNVPVLSTIAKRLCRQFIPLAVLPLPAAVLFRGYDLLFVGTEFVSPGSDFLRYFVVISLPLLALVVTWKTFRYASPLTTRVLGTTALTLGAVAGAGYVAGPRAASTAARWGPRAGLAHAATDQVFTAPSTRKPRTNQDNIASDGDRGGRGGGGVPAYRRSENDPAYY